MSHSRGHRRWPRGPRNALHDAASLGSMAATVAILSSEPFDIDESDPQGFTPLMHAAFAGHTDVTRVLLNRGANVFITEDQGATALFFSVQQGHLDVARLLVQAGSDVETRSIIGHTPLFKAAMKGYTEMARVLVGAGANPNNRGPSGTTPLWAAALGGHEEIVLMLLRAEANPLLAADDEEDIVPLPLDAAAQGGHSDVVRGLIEHVGMKGCGGASGGVEALWLAAELEHVGVMGVLTDAGVVDTGEALCKAAENGCEGSVKFLLQEQQRRKWARFRGGGYVHATGPRSCRTPLTCGIDGYSPRAVRCLLNAGADTTVGVHVSHTAEGMMACRKTPLAYTIDLFDELRADGEGANDEKLKKLEAIRRMLLQVDAVRAVSWLWLRDVSPIGDNSERRSRRTKTTPAADTPLNLMLPIMRRRAGSPGVLLMALWRYSGKASDESAAEGPEICCPQRLAKP
eukprot:g20360.t1